MLLNRPFARVLLRVLGWRIVGEMPDLPRFLVIGAPHTSWFDWFLNLALMGWFELPLRWAGKRSLFRWPWGGLMRAVGGVPVDRGARKGFVGACVSLFATEDRCVIGILPEGTRKRAEHWKSGFYHLALAAGVPVVPVAVDGPTRTMTVGAPRMLTGDPAVDMADLADFFKEAHGVIPANASPVRLESQA